MSYPLRDLFLAFVQRLKDSARRSFEIEVLAYAIRSPWLKDPKPPEIPEILKG